MWGNKKFQDRLVVLEDKNDLSQPDNDNAPPQDGRYPYWGGLERHNENSSWKEFPLPQSQGNSSVKGDVLATLLSKPTELTVKTNSASSC